MEMFIAIFVITFVLLILIALIWDGYEKYKMWRKFNENYEIIIKTLPFIEEIATIKNDIQRGEIVFNNLYYNYKNKEELILNYKRYISSTLDLYNEINENPLISANLEMKKDELEEINKRLMIIIWKNK